MYQSIDYWMRKYHEIEQQLASERVDGTLPKLTIVVDQWYDPQIPTAIGIFLEDSFRHNMRPQDDRYAVYLNGNLLQDVLAADQRRGTVTVWEREWRTGALIPDPDHPSGFRCLSLTGDVVVEEKPLPRIELILDENGQLQPLSSSQTACTKTWWCPNCTVIEGCCPSCNLGYHGTHCAPPHSCPYCGADLKC